MRREGEGENEMELGEKRNGEREGRGGRGKIMERRRECNKIKMEEKCMKREGERRRRERV